MSEGLSLYALRHGKSDWDAAFDADRERPLNERGVGAAREVGRLLANADQAPDLILCSPAVRARTTAKLAAEEGGFDARTEIIDEIYGGGPEVLLAAVRNCAGSARRILVVGHEPSISAFVEVLVGGGRLAFPTAALARVDLDAKAWSEVEPGEGRLRFFVTPKLLAAHRDV